MTTLYIVRHGYSVGNAEKRFAGRADFPLNETGRRQAACTAEFMRDTPLDVILSSPLLRAKETAEAIAKTHGLAITILPDLAEISFGELDGLPVEEVAARYPDVFTTWRNRIIDAAFPGGESTREVAARAQRVLGEILRTYADKRVCVVSHGALIKFMLAYIEDAPLDQLASREFVKNASVSALTFDGGKFDLLYKDKYDYMGDIVTGIPRT